MAPEDGAHIWVWCKDPINVRDPQAGVFMLAQLHANGKRFRLPRAGNVTCSVFDVTLIDESARHGEVVFFGDTPNPIMGNVDYGFWGRPVIKDASVWAWPLESNKTNVPSTEEEARAFFEAVVDVRRA